MSEFCVTLPDSQFRINQYCVNWNGNQPPRPITPANPHPVEGTCDNSPESGSFQPVQNRYVSRTPAETYRNIQTVIDAAFRDILGPGGTCRESQISGQIRITASLHDGNLRVDITGSDFNGSPQDLADIRLAFQRRLSNIQIEGPLPDGTGAEPGRVGTTPGDPSTVLMFFEYYIAPTPSLVSTETEVVGGLYY